MQIICSRFRSLDGESVCEVGFGVIVRGLQFVEAFGGFLPDGHNLKGNHIHLPDSRVQSNLTAQDDHHKAGAGMRSASIRLGRQS